MSCSSRGRDILTLLGAACANGIADGWGSRAAKEGTGFGQANFWDLGERNRAALLLWPRHRCWRLVGEKVDVFTRARAK